MILLELVNIINNLNIISIIFFILGFIFVIVEMFHPGFGAPGILGGILLFLGIIFTAENLIQAVILLIVVLAILGVALAIVLQSFTKGKLSKSMILFESQKKEHGYIGTEDLNYFLGKEGITNTVLRPSGTADFDGVKMDVVSEGEYIEKGCAVKIIKVQGRKILVREIK